MFEPQWLRFLSQRMRWLAIPNIAAVFIGFQVLGFLYVYLNPAGLEKLPLIPSLVLQGEVWRLITFIAIPLSMNILWMGFSLYFQFFVLSSIETQWGEFKTTFYVLISLFLTIIFSMLFAYEINGISNFASTFFLAAAALFPETEIQIYFLPVKMKYLGGLTLAYFILRLLQGSWMDRFFLLTIYSNYLIFFGPALLYRIKEWNRKREFRSKFK